MGLPQGLGQLRAKVQVSMHLEEELASIVTNIRPTEEFPRSLVPPRSFKGVGLNT